VRLYVFELFEKKGDLDPRTAGWRCQADLERAISDYILNHLGKDAAESTIRNHARRLHSEWLNTKKR
jgi:hypothetical protein